MFNWNSFVTCYFLFLKERGSGLINAKTKIFFILRDVNSVDQDAMRLDVWDFNPEESVNEKLTKINQVTPGHL